MYGLRIKRYNADTDSTFTVVYSIHDMNKTTNEIIMTKLQNYFYYVTTFMVH